MLPTHLEDLPVDRDFRFRESVDETLLSRWSYDPRSVEPHVEGQFAYF